MRIPLVSTCECGHAGAAHHDDGTCGLCPCSQFARARARLPVELSGPKAARRRQVRSFRGAPWKDSA